MDQKLCVSLRRTESLPCFSSTSRHQGALQANATVCVCVSPGVCRCASRTRLLAANGDPRAADGRVLRPRVAVHSPVPQEPLHTAGQPPAAGTLCVCVCVSFMMSSAYLGFLKLVDDVARSLCVAPPPQALALRDSCSCPALPATDPRAVFSKSVRVLLETAKHREGGGPEGSREPPPPRGRLPPHWG